MKCPNRAALFLSVAVLCGSANAAVVTFVFEGSHGEELHGSESGTTTASDSGVELTLFATADYPGEDTPVFNRISSGFGVDIDGISGDDTDAIDGGLGEERITFSVMSNVELSSLTVDNFDFDRIDTFDSSDDDAGILAFSDETFDIDSSTVDGSDVLRLDKAIVAGEEFTLSYEAGNGFGLERITFSATAVPEPSSLAILLIGTTGAAITRRNRRRLLKAA